MRVNPNRWTRAVTLPAGNSLSYPIARMCQILSADKPMAQSFLRSLQSLGVRDSTTRYARPRPRFISRCDFEDGTKEERAKEQERRSRSTSTVENVPSL
jgi:hypothetical protein